MPLQAGPADYPRGSGARGSEGQDGRDLYAEQAGKEYYCILTTAANQSMYSVHDRMPLILPEDQVVSWLQSMDDAKHLVPTELDKIDVETQ